MKDSGGRKWGSEGEIVRRDDFDVMPHFTNA